MDQRKILIVDDEEAIRIMLMRMIEPLGHQLFEAPDGQAAFDMTADTEFDLIISDLLMPRMDGLALLENIRGAGCDSSFILLTAYGDLPQALAARDRFNISNFLVKPIHNMDQFLFDVEAAISRRLLERENLSLMNKLQDMNAALESKVVERTKELQEKNVELDRLSNFRADVLKVLGHELRTPLAILKAYHHLIEKNPAQGSTLQERMGGSIDRLQNRVEKALSLLQGTTQTEFPLELSQVDLGDVCASVIARLQPFIQNRNIDLVLKAEGEGIQGMWDREKMEEIVEELLINAARASEDGTRIEVLIESRADRVYLEVSDQGIGLPSDQLERIFEPFVVLGDADHHKSGWVEFGAKGIGIGLSTVRRWTELHGGTVTARPNNGQPGSTFSLVWPQAGSRGDSHTLNPANRA